MQIYSKRWTIAEAKARLSEVIRLSHERPQYIGTKNAYVLVPRDQWEALSHPQENLGKWLVETMAEVGPLSLPSRDEVDRAIPFSDQ